MRLTGQIAECVGLWLAEGDSKTISEVTFTNNSEKLISHFHKCIQGIYNGNNKVRVYSYSPDGTINQFIDGIIFRSYTDKRAKKPYYIYRLADRKFVSRWKELAIHCLRKQKLSPDILRGIFAGEGNIKLGSHSSRQIRLSQGRRRSEFENIFRYLSLRFTYTPSNRMYNFTHKDNWDIFARHKLADLHPEKKVKFWKAFLSFKENHYRANFLKNQMLSLLIEPRTTRWLAMHFGRSSARIYDVLDDLKKGGEIVTFRCNSVNYWIRKDENTVVISSIKRIYLELLGQKSMTTQEAAKALGVTWKSSYRRLSELERLGLVGKQAGKWKKIYTTQKVIIL